MRSHERQGLPSSDMQALPCRCIQLLCGTCGRVQPPATKRSRQIWPDFGNTSIHTGFVLLLHPLVIPARHSQPTQTQSVDRSQDIRDCLYSLRYVECTCALIRPGLLSLALARVAIALFAISGPGASFILHCRLLLRLGGSLIALRCQSQGLPRQSYYWLSLVCNKSAKQQAIKQAALCVGWLSELTGLFSRVLHTNAFSAHSTGPARPRAFGRGC
jgi:hypothetical protein